ncbi:tRNA (adenosine(37)-N6)-threonylcarbamoyltransferase complex transferase subunit TsaD [soil metagenome]
MNILGIETSCDETAAAVVVDGREMHSNVVSSQISIHQLYGGVVPELAARAQLQAIIPVVRQALSDARLDWGGIDGIAVTQGPGLAGSLLVGVNVAKTLAYVMDTPLIPVNHLESHLYANWIVVPGEPRQTPSFPAVCLLVSGGHTELILVQDHGRYVHLGRTLDDAAGEAFDKGARLLGLGYPGGPVIQAVAAEGDPRNAALPRAWLGETHDFSFSGLKTALLREVAPYRLPADNIDPAPDLPFAPHQPPSYRQDMPVADLAAGFEDAIVEVLAVKAVKAAMLHEVETLLLAGGVAANRKLRERIAGELKNVDPERRVKFLVPPANLCTDNAAMVAAAGYFALRRGLQAGWEFDVDARLPLAGVALD